VDLITGDTDTINRGLLGRVQIEQGVKRVLGLGQRKPKLTWLTPLQTQMRGQKSLEILRKLRDWINVREQTFSADAVNRRTVR